jgi:hypothetical protein
MKWILGNLFNCFSILGMFLFTLMLGGMVLLAGIDAWEAVKDSRWFLALWELMCVLVFTYWSIIWVTRGVDWWIEKDHSIQLKLFGKVY